MKVLGPLVTKKYFDLTWTWMNRKILSMNQIMMTIYMECNSYLIIKNRNTGPMINVSKLISC